jgi:hypothetical protein
MKESSYLSALSLDIEKQIGGKVIKTSDRSTLGLPDSTHILDGIVTYIEAKIGDKVEFDLDGVPYVQPWRTVKKDLRQYEVCKSMAKHASVVYAIYYPEIKKSAIITVEVLAQFRPVEGETTLPYLCSEEVLCSGRGIKQLKQVMARHRKEVYGRLSKSFS